MVDPQVSRTAHEADEHLFITPGTDVVWLLALVHVLFADDLVDVGRLAPHVSGVDEVRTAAADFTPERAAAITGIPAEVTRRIAHELATAERAAVYGRVGSHTVAYGTLSPKGWTPVPTTT